MRLIIATTNAGKLREFRRLLKMPGLELGALPDLLPLPVARETGATFLENARLKSAHYHRLLGVPVLADDSGLEVERLDAAPGVRSARYAGRSATDADNIRKLLRELRRRGAAGTAAGKAARPGRAERRLLSRARYVCALSLFSNGNESFFTAAACAGWICGAPAGRGGFGYDPIFYLPAFRKTMAQLGAADKNRISHRALAARELRTFLGRLLLRRAGA